MKTYFKIIFSILLFSLLIPLFAKAITFENPFKAKSFEELIDAIINFIFWVAMAIVPIMIVVAAFYFLTSGGDPEKIRTAKKIILYTFIGLFIIFLAKGIVAIIKQILEGGGPGPGCVPTVPPCDSNCPAGCTVAQDPDCGCQGGNGCCGIGCDNANDSDCPVGGTCAGIGYHCCSPDGCRALHRNDLDPTCGAGEECCQLGCCPDLNPGETCPVTCGDLCHCPSQGNYIPPGTTCH